MEATDELTIERMRSFVRDADLSDPKTAQAWAEQARTHMTELVRLCELLLQRDGGQLGRAILKAVEPEVLKALDARGEAGGVREPTAAGCMVTVHVVSDRVLVDIRLEVRP